jgi:hypothetical protein
MLVAFIAGAVLGIMANNVPAAPPKSITVQLIRRCPQQRDCLRPMAVRDMKDETSKVWSLFDVRIDWIDPVDAATSAIDVTVLLEESAEPAPPWVSKSGGVLADLHLPHTPCGTGVARVWVTQARRHAAAALIPDGPFTSLPIILHDLFLARALGRALAHEIGHYLLGTSRHTARGLMRAHFSPLELREPATRQRYGLDPIDRDALRWCGPVAASQEGLRLVR